MYRIASWSFFVATALCCALNSQTLEAAPVQVSVQSPGGEFRPFQNGQSNFAQKPQNDFQNIPAVIQNMNLSFWYLDTGPGWPKVSNGSTTFTILETGPAWMMTTTRFNGGGNSDGNWMQDVTLQSELVSQGWNMIYSGITDGEHNFLIFERNSLAGETFTYRTEKYIPPTMLTSLNAIPEPSTCVLMLMGIGISVFAIRRRYS